MNPLHAITAAAATAAAVVLAGAQPAQASDPVETFKNLSSGYCLTGQSNWYPDADICTTTLHQRWLVHHWADGTVRLQDDYSGSCIDQTATGGTTYNDGLEMVACDSSQRQSWYVKHYTDGSLRFQNQATRTCLTWSDTYGVVMRACNDTTSQRWR
jgi:hypothetical protein